MLKQEEKILLAVGQFDQWIDMWLVYLRKLRKKKNIKTPYLY